jgi:hypothetical protein
MSSAVLVHLRLRLFVVLRQIVVDRGLKIVDAGISAKPDAP